MNHLTGLFEQTNANDDVERFCLLKSGNVGELIDQEIPSSQGELLEIPFGQKVFGLCGGAGDNFRGWGRYACELLSPRRFARTHAKALFGGKQTPEILTAFFRAVFSSVLQNLPENASDGLIRKTLKDALSRAAMNSGWLLTDFQAEVSRNESGV